MHLYVKLPHRYIRPPEEKLMLSNIIMDNIKDENEKWNCNAH